MLDYFRNLSKGRIVLWCYLIWYVVMVGFYFDPTPEIWFNAVGISAVVGVALLLSVAGPNTSRPDRWQIFRLFMMPFAVSSFSSLIKGRGFLLIVPPQTFATVVGASACAAFVAFVVTLKWLGCNADT
ncbi:hypothetical protein BW247_14535 [Acidihalobacter ferrooxydans]|uniref:Uncharacterized protein n=2 Tax=Acidihalobacter ferrooxydans TaxID=1765967 RepID=A0A1P8ULN8_9GAMM|nr:hypothetical protein BW247_14535 [Acidihalobacter ferrooxydans]